MSVLKSTNVHIGRAGTEECPVLIHGLQLLESGLAFARSMNCCAATAETIPARQKGADSNSTEHQGMAAQVFDIVHCLAR